MSFSLGRRGRLGMLALVVGAAASDVRGRLAEREARVEELQAEIPRLLERRRS
jgi:hypothetical protein